MKLVVLSILLSLGLTMHSAKAFESPKDVTVSPTKHGEVLADTKGMTLYTFDQDSAGKSVCLDKCAEQWPPLTAGAEATPVGDFSVIERDDGTRQWTYREQPLYGWFRDENPGDTTGHGFRGVWRVAKP